MKEMTTENIVSQSALLDNMMRTRCDFLRARANAEALARAVQANCLLWQENEGLISRFSGFLACPLEMTMEGERQQLEECKFDLARAAVSFLRCCMAARYWGVCMDRELEEEARGVFLALMREGRRKGWKLKGGRILID